MRVLITGGSGLLGRYLLKTRPANCAIAAATYHKNSSSHSSTDDTIWYHLDVRNRADVCDVFKEFRPDVVIHCAAIGSVDFAEDPEGYQPVFDVNVTGTKHIVDMCNGYKTKMIFISTNAVFSGKQPPYNEKSPLEPVNQYGVIKRHAEQAVRNFARKWVIVRPFMLYGWPWPGGRTNWAVKLIKGLGGKSYKLVHDHIWMPTYAGDAAKAVWQLSDQDHEIYNVAAPERATLYEFGLKVCEVFDLERRLIQSVESGHFPTLAARPKDTEYDLVKLTKAGIMLSDIKTGLERMRAENERSNSHQMDKAFHEPRNQRN
jgi:dTDP-4-dehydrorhamnose reductase